VAVGSMVYEWGHVDSELVDHDRSTTKTRGRYLTVWRRDSDGRWRILHNLSLPE